MTSDRHERIRKRAHAIWEKDGRPQGVHEEHWHQATKDIDAEDAKLAGKAPAKAAKAAVKPKAKEAAKPKAPGAAKPAR
jgi:hypothetical protein